MKRTNIQPLLTTFFSKKGTKQHKELDEKLDFCNKLNEELSLSTFEPSNSENAFPVLKKVCKSNTNNHDDGLCKNKLSVSTLKTIEEQSQKLENSLKALKVYTDLNCSADNSEECAIESFYSSSAASESLYFQEYMKVMLVASQSQFSYNMFPSWIMPSKILDINKNNPLNTEYNVGTIWIPDKSSWNNKNDMKHFSPAMAQFWSIKSNHFDKMGKFYELFYIDAYIANKICKLKWMGSSDGKPHVGFPEVSLHVYAKQMIDAGFKVVVVEQMETPKELENRNKELNARKEKAVKREICEIYSCGTILNGSMLSQDVNYLVSMSTSRFLDETAVIFTDVSTCKIWISTYRTSGALTSLSKKAETLNYMKNILFRLNPVEIILDHKSNNDLITSVIKNLSKPPHVNFEIINSGKSIFTFIEEKLGSGFESSFDCSGIVSNNKRIIDSEVFKYNETRKAFHMLYTYLKKCLIADKIFPFAKLFLYEFDKPNLENCKKTLAIDATALRHLSILRDSSNDKRNTLSNYLDHTVTASGHRLLKKWIVEPLYHPDEINSRLDCVEWLINNTAIRKNLQTTFKSIPDIERQLTKVCMWSLQSSRSAVYFENIHSKQFGEFVNMLDTFLALEKILTNLGDSLHTASSAKRLRFLCTPQIKENGQLPILSEQILVLKNQLVQDCTTKEWTIVDGYDEQYDELKLKITDAENQILQYLEDMKQAYALNTQCQKSLDLIKYVNVKYAFEIECPESHDFWTYVKRYKSNHYEITSSRQGYIRFQTYELKKLVQERDYLKTYMSDILYSCQQKLSKDFYFQNYAKCTTMLDIMAEVDVLCGFALLSESGVKSKNPNASNVEIMCRPQLLDSNIGLPLISLKTSRHPIIALSYLLKKNYIPSDIFINDPEHFEGKNSFNLITGPNMGGKSTLLRQVCLIVIIAQVGCYVPAFECKLSPVDKIYTRLGAQDSILEGKSTFYIEVEEAANAISGATKNSLIIFDELGRGTSSCDGTALAFAVSKFFASTMICRCLYATHFQLITQNLQRFPNVQLLHMDMQIQNGKIQFLYQLLPGVCHQSYGIEIARLANIDSQICQSSETRSKILLRNSTILYMIAQLKELQVDYSKQFHDDSYWLKALNIVKNINVLRKFI